MSQHTPTPWDYSGEFITASNNKIIIAEVRTGEDICHDSAFIVRAVNSHEALLTAAKKAADYINDVSDLDEPENEDIKAILNKAITQAEAKP